MIVEIAHITIKPDTNGAFEAAVEQAVAVFNKAKGCKGLQLQHCIEAPNEYDVVIHWDSVEDHTISFQKGPLFIEWRALVGPFFNKPPEVKHYNIAMDFINFSGSDA